MIQYVTCEQDRYISQYNTNWSFLVVLILWKNTRIIICWWKNTSWNCPSIAPKLFIAPSWLPSPVVLIVNLITKTPGRAENIDSSYLPFIWCVSTIGKCHQWMADRADSLFIGVHIHLRLRFLLSAIHWWQKTIKSSLRKIIPHICSLW